MVSDIRRLVIIIEKELDWGNGSNWQIRDFDTLRQRIADETGVTLSTSTLRRIWGRLHYDHLPSTVTLDALAFFAGYDNWRAFLQSGGIDNSLYKENEPRKLMAAPRKRKLRIRTVLIAMTTIMLIAIGALLAINKKNFERRNNKKSEYRFDSKQLTHELPNSVVFTYDASAAATDSIFIQQEWDPDSRVRVEKNGHTHTSIYYEPAFYHPRLMIGRQAVKEHSLLIATNGWLGLIKNKPVPVYLDKTSFVHTDALRIPVTEMQQLVPQMEKEPPVLRYYNVGNFDPVPVSDFSFSAALKNEYGKGAAACRFSDIVLLTDDAPIVIPLSGRGCTSELTLYAVNHTASGKTTDLSSFGVDFSHWVTVSCKSNNNIIRFYVDNKLVYQCLSTTKPVNIIGLEFAFSGTGAVKNIRLATGSKMMFEAF